MKNTRNAADKRKLSFFYVFLSVLALLPSCSEYRKASSDAALNTEKSQTEKIKLYYFYEELCASCPGGEEFSEIAAKELAEVRDKYPYEIYSVNVYTDAGSELFEKVTAGMNVTRENLPLLAAGGLAFSGNSTISANLREAFLTAGEDLFVYKAPYNPLLKKTGAALFEDAKYDPSAVTLVYFYRTVCDACNAVKPFVDALPSSISLMRFNTRSGNNGERILAFFDYYKVPDKDRQVPIIFTADNYFAGRSAIEKGLESGITKTGFPFFDALKGE